MDVKTSFGRWLRHRRRALDLTQGDLARRVGCAVITIQKLEADERRPSRLLVERLADSLQVAAEERTTLIRLARAELYLDPTAVEASESPPHVPERSLTNLPTPLTHLIGRKQDIAGVRTMLLRSEVRLLTVIGPPGIGKTRLSIEVAREVQSLLGDGASFVALALVGDPALLLATIAQTLGVRESTGQLLLDQLKLVLHSKRLLLVLDNFEHLRDAAPLIVELLEACAGLKALVTSRAALHVRGERLYTLPPLLLPDLTPLPATAWLVRNPAVALFVERAQAVKPDFRLTAQNARTVAEICVRLDGLPLAIELAATWIRLLSPQTVLERLEQRLALLTDGARDLPPRHRTLRSAIAWSYELVDAGEQRLFSRLGVFMGGCTQLAAEVVCTVSNERPPDVLGGLATLVDTSLLLRAEGRDGEPRFVMLETIREYALERLAEQGEVDTLHDRHLDYYLQLAEATAPHIRQPGQMGRLGDEHDNLRTAFEWAIKNGAVERAARISTALQHYMESRGLLSEARAWLAAVLMHRTELPAPVRAKALWAAAEIAESLADEQALFEESLSIFRALGDNAGIAAVLSDLGGLAQWRADYGQARACFDERLALYRELGDRDGEIGGLIRLGRLAHDEGDSPRAAVLHEESLALARANGSLYGVARALFGLGEIAQRAGEHDLAAARYGEALRLMRELEQSGHTSHVLIHLGALAVEQGDLVGATAHYTECLRLVVERSDSLGTAHCLGGFAQLAAANGQLERAARLAGAAAALFDALAVPRVYTERADLDRVVAGWRTQLGEATFAPAWAQGQAMLVEQAIVDALNVDIPDSGAPETTR